MASGRTDSDGPRLDREVRLGLAVAAPLVVVALAYALWWVSDRLLYIGPLDRAAFGWAVVVPVWLCAPIAAGLAWRRLTVRATAAAAVLSGTVISLAFAFMFWEAVAHPGCEYGATRTPLEWVVPSLFVGIVVGVGVALSSLLAVMIVRRGHPWRAAVASALVAFACIFVAILAFVVVASGPGCQRPADLTSTADWLVPLHIHDDLRGR
jgi:hypothetical protein